MLLLVSNGSLYRFLCTLQRLVETTERLTKTGLVARTTYEAVHQGLLWLSQADIKGHVTCLNVVQI